MMFLGAVAADAAFVVHEVNADVVEGETLDCRLQSPVDAPAC